MQHMDVEKFVRRAGRGCLSRTAILLFRDTINTCTSLGSTALHEAIVHHHSRVALMLLAAEADVHVRDRSGATPLDLALSHNCGPPLLRALMYAGADVKSGNIFARIVTETPKRNWLELLRVMLVLPATFIPNRDEKLLHARDLTRPTRNRFAPLQAHALICAALGVEVLGVYVPPPPPPPPLPPLEHRFIQALYWAPRDALCLVDEFEALGVDVAHATDENGTTALHWAAYHDDEVLVDELLGLGADPNAARTDTGGTPMLWAARRGGLGVIERLIGFGGDLHHPNAYGLTPIMLLAKRNVELRTHDTSDTQ